MTESKIGITHRLQHDGRWAEASRFKDKHIAKLRSEGTTRREAQQSAWKAMEKRFPPLSVESIPEELEAFPAELATQSSNSPDEFADDTLWVYRSLGLAEVKPKDAPSPGAWSLLRWAKRNEDRFFEHTMPKVMTHKKKMKVTEDLYEDDLSELDKMIHDFVRQGEEAAIANTPDWVRQEVRSKMVDWKRRCDVSLGREAEDRLAQMLTEVVDFIIKLALEKPEALRVAASVEEG